MGRRVVVEAGSDGEEFRARRDGLVNDYGVFLALTEQLGADWRSWPADLRDPRSSAVRDFADQHARKGMEARAVDQLQKRPDVLRGALINIFRGEDAVALVGHS